MYARVYSGDVNQKFAYLDKKGEVQLEKSEDEMTLSVVDMEGKVVWEYCFKRAQPQAVKVFRPGMLEIHNFGNNVIMLHLAEELHALALRDNLLSFWSLKDEDIECEP